MKEFINRVNYKSLSLLALLVLILLISATGFFMYKSKSAGKTVQNAINVILHLKMTQVNIENNEKALARFIRTGIEKPGENINNWFYLYRNDSLVYNNLVKEFPRLNKNFDKVYMLALQKSAADDNIKNLRQVFGSDSLKNDRRFKTGGIVTDFLKKQIELVETRTELILNDANKSYIRSNQVMNNMLILLVIFFVLSLFLLFMSFRKENELRMQANKALTFNASLIKNISDPIVTTDVHHSITNWNRYAEQLYGFTEEEVIGKPLSEILHISYPLDNKAEIIKLYEEHGIWHGEVIHYTKAGIALHVEVNSSMIKNDEGEMTGTVAVIRNITKRKETQAQLNKLTTQLEEEVKLKTAELSNVFERITDAFIALDNEWRYTYVNNKAAEMHGKQPHELLGKSIWDVFPEVVNEPFYNALYHARETQQPLKLTLPYSSSGRWFEDLIYPSEDGISVYYHDITEKKNAELELRSAHYKLFHHINNTPLAVVEFDENFKIIQWSKRSEEIFGWTKDEVLQDGFDTYGIVYKEDISKVRQQEMYLYDTDTTSGILHNRNITKSGRVIFCEWYNSVIKNEKDNTTGIMSLVQEVTGRRLMEIELQEAEAKFRNLVEKSLVGVYIFQGKKFVYINPVFGEMFGYGQFEILENPEILELVFEENNEMVLEHIEEQLTKNDFIKNHELKGRHQSGRNLFLEIYGTATQFEGSPAIIGTLINVTERKKAEDQMARVAHELFVSNERFNFISKATNDAIWDWDMVTDRIWGNDIFNRTFKLKVDGKVSLENFRHYIYPGDWAVLVDRLKSEISKKSTFFTAEFRLITADGGLRYVNNRAYIVYNTDGRAYRMLGALQDVTTQIKYQQQIIAEKEISDTIINSLPGIFYLYNYNGKFLRWNKNLEKISGYNFAEIEQIKPAQFFTAEELVLLAPKIENIFKDGEGNVEANLVTKSGDVVPFYLTGKLINCEGENCLMGVGIDISEKKSAQLRIRKSEEKFRMLIEQASDGILITDNNGKFTEVNRSASRITGYSKSELLNMHLNDLLVQNMEKSLILQDELIQGKTLISASVINHKRNHNVTIEISAKLLPDGRFQGIIRDITDRIKADDALKQSENKYKLMFNQNPMPMWMISLPEKRFLDVNPAAIELYQYSREEFLGMTSKDIRAKDYQAEFAKLGSKISNGVQHAGIWKHMKKDGSQMDVNIITHDVIYEGRHAKLVLANDVTEKLAAEEKLIKSNADFRQLASHLEKVRESERTNIAREIHDELGQQLTGLKMDMSWLKKKIVNTDPQVLDKLDDTMKLIDNTVISVRKIATELRPSILDDLGLISAMEWQSEEFQKRSEIKVNFTSHNITREIENEVATQIFRIYQESLTNILRHAEATKITASLQVKGNKMVLSIYDNGKGFNADEILNKKTLGLLGMRERAKMLNGSFDINTSLGKGTVLTIVIPLT